MAARAGGHPPQGPEYRVRGGTPAVDRFRAWEADGRPSSPGTWAFGVRRTHCPWLGGAAPGSSATREETFPPAASLAPAAAGRRPAPAPLPWLVPPRIPQTPPPPPPSGRAFPLTWARAMPAAARVPAPSLRQAGRDQPGGGDSSGAR